jgi:SAM-dependent methyltransferase
MVLGRSEGRGRADEGRDVSASARVGILARVDELVKFAKSSFGHGSARVARQTLGAVRTAENRLLEYTGLRLENLRVLEIGPGHHLRHMRCLALRNDVVGIDTDIIPQGFQIADYLRLLGSDPPLLVVKTLGRQMFRQDARFKATLARELGVESSSFAPLPVLRMSATEMSFPDDSFEFVCSFSVFEHIDDPAAALREVGRVLRPGGVAYISVRLYTSPFGQTAPTRFTTRKPRPPLWPHLRPAFEHIGPDGAYVNRLPLAEWEMLFVHTMPGVYLVAERHDDEIGDALALLREEGELADYTDDELMTTNLIGIWKKP